MTIRTDILTRTADTLDARGEMYGTPEQSFKTIAAFWSIILQAPITPVQVSVMMAGLKLARLSDDPARADNAIDLAGYAVIAHELSNNHKGKGKKG